MKALLLLLAFVFIGCSEDEPPVENCQRIISLGWSYDVGSYIKLKDGTEILTKSNEGYELGEIYCR